MHAPCSSRAEIARLRSRTSATQREISGHAERLRAQVAARQRESDERCALSRSALAETHRPR